MTTIAPARIDTVLDQSFSYRVVKRALDIVVSALALVILSPILSLIALLVKLTSPGPVLYRWPVVGKGGKPLRAYKFRTMVIGADEQKKDLMKYNEASGPMFKMKDDPRVTPIGRVLRKHSLDELPQLWTVLVGDMSLVGPRPVLTSEWEHFSGWQRQKLSVKPGGICLWHVSGQPRGFEDWLRLDLAYIENWSLWLDIRILFGAVFYVLAGKNC